MPFGFRGICHFDTDRGRRDDRGHDYHEDRRRSDARDRVLDCGQRDYRDSELNLLKSSSAVTSTLRGLLKDSMGQVIDAALNLSALVAKV